jgi:hypothetical protein
MPTAYPTLRSVLRPELAEASDAFIESAVQQHYGGAMDAAEAEEFLNNIGRSLGQFGKGVANVARQAAPHVLNALPGALSGAATGAAMGPWGALAGAAIGGVTGAIGSVQAAQAGQPGRSPQRAGSSGQSPRATRPARAGQRGAGAALGQIAGLAGPALQGLAGASGNASLGQLAGIAGPVLGALAQGGSGGAGGVGGQIAGLLGRPEVQQALMSTLMGSLGRQNVGVGGAQVPTGAVMNMMGTLFQRAGQPAGGSAEDESIPAYLLDAGGQPRIDLADAEARADALAEWFQISAPPAGVGEYEAEAAWTWQDVDEGTGWVEGFDEDLEDEAYESIDEDFEAVALTTSRRDLEAAGW